MGRKVKELNCECGKRLSEWLSEIDMTQDELARLIGYTQQYISNIVTGKKPMTVEFAKLVSEKTSSGMSLKWDKPIHIRASYLLELDDIRTNIDYQEHFTERSNMLSDSALYLLDNALREVAMKEELSILLSKGLSEDKALEEVVHMKLPELNNIPEILFLQAQLMDYSYNIMWSYLHHRKESPIWNILDKEV